MIAAWQMIFGAVPLFLLGLIVEGSPLHFHWTGRALFCLLYLALIGSALAFLLLYWLLPRMPVNNLQTISLITPPGRGGDRLAGGRRDVFALVAARRRVRPGGCLDDFSQGARRWQRGTECEALAPRLMHDHSTSLHAARGDRCRTPWTFHRNPPLLLRKCRRPKTAAPAARWAASACSWWRSVSSPCCWLAAG